VPNVTGLASKLLYFPASDDDHHGPIMGKEMTVQFASHKIKHRVSDNDIVVGSESSSKSLEEIGQVQKLPPHQRDSLSESSSSKGKSHAEDVDIEFGSAGPAKGPKILKPKSDDYDILQIYGSDPGKWWPPKSQREINDMIPTPAHLAQHRKAKILQFCAVGGVISSVVVTPIYVGMALYYASIESASVWGPVGWSLGAGVTAAFGAWFLYLALRSRGVVRHTESNLS
jgi:hypothetical protein